MVVMAFTKKTSSYEPGGSIIALIDLDRKTLLKLNGFADSTVDIYLVMSIICRYFKKIQAYAMT